MLSKHRCPHTRVLNFFTDTDPFISVASVIAIAPGHHVWRCHIGEGCGGTTANAASAEANLRRVLEMPDVALRRTYARRQQASENRVPFAS